MFSYEISILITYAGVIVLIFVLGKLLKMPLKVAAKLMVNSLLGAACIIVFNYFGILCGWNIPLNLVTAVTIGALGVPGALLLFAIFVI